MGGFWQSCKARAADTSRTWKEMDVKLTRNSYGNDTYEHVQKRREAAIVLDNPELLMMHAQARFDVSLPVCPKPSG
jgi:chitinase